MHWIMVYVQEKQELEIAMLQNDEFGNVVEQKNGSLLLINPSITDC